MKKQMTWQSLDPDVGIHSGNWEWLNVPGRKKQLGHMPEPPPPPCHMFLANDVHRSLLGHVSRQRTYPKVACESPYTHSPPFLSLASWCSSLFDVFPLCVRSEEEPSNERRAWFQIRWQFINKSSIRLSMRVLFDGWIFVVSRKLPGLRRCGFGFSFLYSMEVRFGTTSCIYYCMFYVQWTWADNTFMMVDSVRISVVRKGKLSIPIPFLEREGVFLPWVLF